MQKVSEVFDELAPKCCAISRSKGFWDEGDARSKGEMVALIVSELSECIEASRSEKTRPIDWKERLENEIDSHWSERFKVYVKDTIEDELADTVIRIFDYVIGWHIRVYDRDFRKESTGNFAHDILRIQWYAILAFHGDDPSKDWGYVLAAIQTFCDWHNIDIVQHIQWKMKYNETRPYKHNKSY